MLPLLGECDIAALRGLGMTSAQRLECDEHSIDGFAHGQAALDIGACKDQCHIETNLS